jgi:hypothetical protein
MTTAPTDVIPSRLSLSIVALRRHAALVRALLEELERIAPAVGGSADREVVAEQLIEELSHLGHRILECAGTRTPKPATPGDSESDPSGLRFARRPAPASSSRFKAAPPTPGPASRERPPSPSGQ